jgi:hypothetical protein
MIELPRNVQRVTARGRDYYYYQEGRGTSVAGPRIRIKSQPHEPEFWAEIKELGGSVPPPPERGTFSALVTEYKRSPEYADLKPKTKKEYERYLGIIIDTWGGLKVAGVRSKHVLALRDRFAETPAMANYLLVVLSAIVNWSMPRDYANINPCQGIRSEAPRGKPRGITALARMSFAHRSSFACP